MSRPVTSLPWIHGHVLAPAGHRTAEAEPKRRQHLRERAAVRVEHDAGAHLGHAQAELGAACASRSHSTHTCARKSCPGGASSSIGSSPCGP